MFYTYLLKSQKRNWVYVGSTADLKQRFNDHNSGLVKSTKFYVPLELVYFEAYKTLGLAKKREYEIKNNCQQKEIILKRIGLMSGEIA